MVAHERLICDSAALLDGGDGVRFEVQWHGATEPAFVVRAGDRVYAYLNRCAHSPIELDWQPGRFFDFSGLYLVCSVHGALYSPQNGACLGGRCDGKGLRPLVVTEKDGRVYLIESD